MMCTITEFFQRSQAKKRYSCIIQLDVCQGGEPLVEIEGINPRRWYFDGWGHSGVISWLPIS